MPRFSPELHRHLVPIVLAQGIGLACGIAGVRLVSAWVAPADFGALAVFVSAAGVGASVIFAGLVKFVSRHWRESPDRAGLLRAVAAALVRKSVWLLPVAVGAAWLAAPEGKRLLYAALFFACAFLLGAVQLAQSSLQAMREHYRDLGLAATLSIGRSFLPPLLYATTAGGLAALLVGFSLHALVAVAVGAWLLGTWWRQPLGAPTTLPATYEGWRFVLLALAGWALLGMNRWLVAALFGIEAAGFFALAANIGAILPTMAGSVLLQFFQPGWFALPSETPRERQALARSVDAVAFAHALLGLLLVLALHRAMPLLVGTLVDERYRPAAQFVFAAGCATLAYTLGSFYHALLIAARLERSCFHVDLSGAAILVAGSAASALAGMDWFTRWLILSPVVPLLVNRQLARRALLGPDRGRK